VSIDARPSTEEAAVNTSPPTADQGVDAYPIDTSIDVDTTLPPSSPPADDTFNEKTTDSADFFSYFVSIYGLFSFCRVLASYPLSLPSRIYSLSFLTRTKEGENQDSISEKPPLAEIDSPLVISDISPVCQ
jgi:hypothetical protein